MSFATDFVSTFKNMRRSNRSYTIISIQQTPHKLYLYTFIFWSFSLFSPITTSSPSMIGDEGGQN